MKRYTSWIYFLLVVFLVGTKSAHAEEGLKMSPTPTLDLWAEFKGPVHDDPRIIGKSFSFKGRAGYRDGNLTSLKIWMVGTKRIVGVLTNGCIPDNLAKVLKNDLGAQVYGIFTVYAFSPYKEGTMQFVCIDSVKITKVIKGK